MSILSKVSGLLVGVGLGIIMVSCLAAAIYFGKISKGMDEFEISFTRRFPHVYLDVQYNCALCITIFSCIAFAAAIGGIAVSALLGGQKMIIAIVGIVAAACTLVTFICEIVFYTNYRKRYLLDELKPFEDHDVLYYRNSSSARKYIKNALKDFYEQALANYKEYKPAGVDLDKIYSWEDVEKSCDTHFDHKIGDETYHAYFNYPNLWTSLDNIDDYYPMQKADEEKEYIRFYTGTTGLVNTRNVIYSVIGDHATTAQIVASYDFNLTDAKTYTQYKRFCWNTSSKAYKCKDLEDKDTHISFHPQDFANTHYQLHQLFTLKDYYFSPNFEEKENEEYLVMLLIDNFPFAYHLMDKKAIEEAQSNLISTDEAKRRIAFIFEDDTRHFGFSPKSYLKAQYKNQKSDAKNTYEYGFFWCNDEPKDYKDAHAQYKELEVGGDKRKIYKCNLRTSYTVNSFLELSYQFTIGDSEVDDQALYDDAEQPLRETFGNVYYGHFPGFYKKYKLSELNVFKYPFGDEEDDTQTAQFAFASFLIHLFAVLIYACGLTSGFLTGGDSE